MSKSAYDIITDYNAHREPERLAIKMAIMRAGPFGFLRGSAHLFWRRVGEADVPALGPAAWCSCDQHLENFGTYRGDNGLAYFDLNDFDEAALAPAEWEILRTLVSLIVSAPALQLAKIEIRELARRMGEAYRRELATGKARWIERRTAIGAIDELMAGLKKRDRVRLLDRRTIMKKGLRRLDPDNTRTLPATEADKQALARFAASLGKARGVKDYFTFLDGARRIAGTGSLGLPRFVLLLEGHGSPDGNVILDLKQAQASSMIKVKGIDQPKWENDAVRVVQVQRRCQAIAPGQLSAVTFDNKPFVLKELQPTIDRLNLARIVADRRLLSDALETMGELIAWAQLRSSGRDGSAKADHLIAFAEKGDDFVDHLVKTAGELASVVLKDYKDFCNGYDADHKSKPA